MRWHALHAALLSKTSNPSYSSRDSKPGSLVRRKRSTRLSLETKVRW